MLAISPKALGWHLCVLGFVAWGSAPAQAGFTIRDLGVIVSSGTSGGEAINSAGQVAGVASNAAGTPVAAIFDGPRGIRAVTLPAGSGQSMATGINAAGTASGSYQDSKGVEHGFTDSGGTVTTLDPLKVGGLSGTFTHANGINGGGTVVGYGDLPSGGPIRAFYATSGGSATIINPLGAGGFDKANGINDSGVVVGTSETSPGGLQHAFLTDVNHNATELAGPAGRNPSGNFSANTFGTAIANDGDAVGYGDVGGSEHAFYASSVKGVGLVDLGVLAGTSSSLAEGVNDFGLVVGKLGVGFNPSNTRAFLWGASSGLFDLNGLLSTSDQAHWVLTQANGINDSNQISGVGLLDGVAHAFALTPSTDGPLFGPAGSVPTPPSLVLSALGGALVFGWSRRKIRRGRIGGRAAA